MSSPYFIRVPTSLSFLDWLFFFKVFLSNACVRALLKEEKFLTTEPPYLSPYTQLVILLNNFFFQRLFEFSHSLM